MTASQSRGRHTCTSWPAARRRAWTATWTGFSMPLSDLSSPAGGADREPSKRYRSGKPGPSGPEIGVRQPWTVRAARRCIQSQPHSSASCVTWSCQARSVIGTIESWPGSGHGFGPLSKVDHAEACCLANCSAKPAASPLRGASAPFVATLPLTGLMFGQLRQRTGTGRSSSRYRYAECGQGPEGHRVPGGRPSERGPCSGSAR